MNNPSTRELGIATPGIRPHDKGLARRDDLYWEYPVRLPFLIRAVALPVRANGRLVGSMALHWPMDQAPVERVLSLHLASLESTIRDVQQALA